MSATKWGFDIGNSGQDGNPPNLSSSDQKSHRGGKFLWQPNPVTLTEAEQAIRALAQENVKHYNARDIEKLVTFFAKDGRTLAPYRPLAEGTAAVRQAASHVCSSGHWQQRPAGLMPIR